MQRITLPALAAAVVQLLIAASADAADLKLFGGGHFQGSGQPLVEAFSRKAGIIASYTPGNTGGPALKRRLDAGEMMDVIVMNRDDMVGVITPVDVCRALCELVGKPAAAPTPVQPELERCA